MGLAMAMGNLQKFSGDMVRLGYGLKDAVESYPLGFRIGASLFWFAFAVLWFLDLIPNFRGKAPPGNKKRLLLAGSLFLFGVLAFVSEAAGAASTVQLISSWLLYQGF